MSGMAWSLTKRVTACKKAKKQQQSEEDEEDKNAEAEGGRGLGFRVASRELRKQGFLNFLWDNVAMAKPGEVTKGTFTILRTTSFW